MKWFRLYTEIMDDPKLIRLSDRGFRILIGLFCLTSEAEKNGCLPYSIEQLRWRLRCRKDHLESTLKLCQELNIIKDNGNGYEVINWNKRQFKSDNSYERVKRFRNVSVTANETAPEQNRTEQIQKQIKPPIIPLKDFEEFWRIYPKKIGKGHAKVSWKKIRPSGELTIKIMDAVKIQIESEQWRKDGGQFIPHPATWLNQERWEDEPDSHKKIDTSFLSEKGQRSWDNVDKMFEGRKNGK